MRPVIPCARTIAISFVGSVATTLNSPLRPSETVTTLLVESGGAVWMGATTWLLVMISPSEVRTMPEPVSDSSPAFVSSVTTLGNTLAATCSTESGAEKSTAARGGREPGTNNCPPTTGGRTTTATAKLMAANNIAATTPRMMNVQVRGSLCRSAVTDIAQGDWQGDLCRPAG